ncbi:MAG TPA: polysaccharide biosynthesis/export family protein [Caulobacteraceae bacterium]|jgi:polysaccharide export outer membrane protein|nr:polysaccharide biosynthesis/export family protein [Caulobacteraceae bacterium]
MVTSTLIRIAALSAVVLATTLADAHAQASAQPSRVSADREYVLGPEDVVEVSVVGRDDFKIRARVASDGTIRLPFIGSVTAANKTTVALAADVASSLESGGYFSHPVLDVEIVSYASHYVTVLGAVGAPGLVPIDRTYHLSDILARVGGVKDTAADYVVIRHADGGERRLLISSIAAGDASQDPIVIAGDKIFSPPSQVFYISGQVKTPGAYSLNDGLSVRMAIARGGGLTDLGTDRGVKVTHADGRREKPGLQAKVSAGDVIVVSERLF